MKKIKIDWMKTNELVIVFILIIVKIKESIHENTIFTPIISFI
jgi:hypothetical protein